MDPTPNVPLLPCRMSWTRRACHPARRWACRRTGLSTRAPTSSTSTTRRPSRPGATSCAACPTPCCGCCASRRTGSPVYGPRRPPVASTPTASSSRMSLPNRCTSAAPASLMCSWTRRSAMPTPLVRGCCNLGAVALRWMSFFAC